MGKYFHHKDISVICIKYNNKSLSYKDDQFVNESKLNKLNKF